MQTGFCKNDFAFQKLCKLFCETVGQRFIYKAENNCYTAVISNRYDCSKPAVKTNKTAVSNRHKTVILKSFKKPIEF